MVDSSDLPAAVAGETWPAYRMRCLELFSDEPFRFVLIAAYRRYFEASQDDNVVSLDIDDAIHKGRSDT